jgi:MinD-like ATPase involved in chromosome partitioning or flagellar assembly
MRKILVASSKGGCGKTTIATNLGATLAAGGERTVCIVDLDLAFGDVAISVQLDPAKTIVDALPMAGHLDETGAASLLTRYQPNLEMLLAPTTPGDAEKIPPALVHAIIEKESRHGVYTETHEPGNRMSYGPMMVLDTTATSVFHVADPSSLRDPATGKPGISAKLLAADAR